MHSVFPALIALAPNRPATVPIVLEVSPQGSDDGDGSAAHHEVGYEAHPSTNETRP